MRTTRQKSYRYREIKGILDSTRIIHLGMMDGDYPCGALLHFRF